MGKGSTIFGERVFSEKPKNPKTTKKTTKPRKKRSDAKHDIKFKVTSEEKRRLKIEAIDYQLSLTAFASFIVKMELAQLKEYQGSEYDHGGQFIHVMLNAEDFKSVQRLAVEWGLPLRHVAHRIVTDHVRRLTGGLTIIDYRSGEK